MWVLEVLVESAQENLLDHLDPSMKELQHETSEHLVGNVCNKCLGEIFALLVLVSLVRAKGKRCLGSQFVGALQPQFPKAYTDCFLELLRTLYGHVFLQRL